MLSRRHPPTHGKMERTLNNDDNDDDDDDDDENDEHSE